MADEKFLTYTETDPNSRITRTDSRVSWAAITKNEDAYAYYDKGADYFNGDFVHLLTIRSIGPGGAVGLTARCSYWALANLVDDYVGIDDASGDGLFLFSRMSGSTHYLRLNELDGGDTYGSAADFQITANTDYYLKIVRDESVGTYGTLYLYVYATASRATPVNTQSITLHSSKKDYRYLYAFQTINAGDATRTHTGYTKNLSITTSSGGGGEASTLPEVWQQTPTDIAATTCTGNGHILYLGLSSVTAHGHCWKTEATYLTDGILPLTSDSNVDNGAGSVGAFTSAVTGLTAGTRYIMRAYATNTQGTAYSIVSYIWRSGDSSILEAGNTAVKLTALHYVGADGVEYSIQGTAV